MSGNLEALQRQIDSGEELQSIVRTMKALAATNVRQYEKAVESLGDYYLTVQMGMAVVFGSRQGIRQPPAADPRKPVLLLVFGSDHGLAGRFNEQIVNFTLEKYREGQETASLPENRIIGCIGEQAYTRLLAAGHESDRLFGVPVSMAAITVSVQTLLERIEEWRQKDSVQRVLLFYNRPVAGAAFTTHTEQMLPVDPAKLWDHQMKWATRAIPTFTMPAEQLLSALLRQYFFVSLFRAYALSLAAENASRLAAMQAAEKNIDERLDQLITAFQQERQAAITAELLDIIAGFKALSGNKNQN